MKKKYVILEGIEHGNKFYTTNISDDHTKLNDGTVAYKVLGFVDTSEEAENILYPTQKDFEDVIRDNIRNMGIQYREKDIDRIVDLCK